MRSVLPLGPNLYDLVEVCHSLLSLIKINFLLFDHLYLLLSPRGIKLLTSSPELADYPLNTLTVFSNHVIAFYSHSGLRSQCCFLRRWKSFAYLRLLVYFGQFWFQLSFLPWFGGCFLKWGCLWVSFESWWLPGVIPEMFSGQDFRSSLSLPFS